MSERVVEKREKVKWTTWEELLLTYAVKRHGIKDWDSIAMELQNRSSDNIPFTLTAQACKIKYRDLKRRFIGDRDDDDDNIETGGDDEVDSTIPWLEDLRKLRVSELKQEVQRYDLSIQSLQLKVKRLEREREDNENRDGKPDLDKDSKEDRSEDDKTDGDAVPEMTKPEQAAGKSVSGQFSDRENRSFNESNSTGEKGDNRETEAEAPATAENGVGKPDRALSESKPVGEDSCNDSSDTASKPTQKNKVGNSGELRDSGTESKEGTKESSEVQSSASLTRKKRRRREAAGGGNGGGGDEKVVVSPATTTTTTTTTKGETMKSEPLVGLLDIIRSHKYGSVFERRLEIQKTEKYKKIVRQHMDLETVQIRFNDGSYSSCPTKLHRDMLLLFNNAIVFFPKTSSESLAASKLRYLLLKEMKKIRTQTPDLLPDPAPLQPLQNRPKPDPERSDSLLAKQKSSAPIVVCRKRSSISAKPSNPNKAEKQTSEKPDLDLKPSVKSSPSVKEEQSPTKMKTREKPVTGTRSLRKGNRSQANSKPNENNQTTNTTGSTDHKIETSKKRSSDQAAKKRGAADFLKRIKKQSPGKGTLLERLKSSGNEGGNGRKDQKKRENGKKEEIVRRSGGGGKQVEESSPSKRSVGRPPKRGREVVQGKRGREGGEIDGVSSKRPNKRSRK